MENKEIQEINVEKELPKTLEEYVIKEIESLKKMNADLVETLRISRTVNFKQNEEVLEWKNKYYELVRYLKEDFGPTILKIHNGKQYFSFTRSWTEDPKKDKYYIELFDLKEEGEEDNE